MGAKVKGSKKRVTAQRPPICEATPHNGQPPSLGGPIFSPTSDASKMVPSLLNIDLMSSRRELIFASLVGQRLSVITRDGCTISGVMTMYNNGSLLPSSWQQSSSEPNPETVYVYTGSRVAVADDDGWRVVNKQKKRLPPPTTRPTNRAASEITSMLDEQSVSSSSETTSCPAFELFHSERRAANQRRQNCLWLRCAYRQASASSRSSLIYDWLAVPWDSIEAVLATNVPDNPDAVMLQSRRITFQTDGEIAGSARQHSERQLQPWTEDETSAALGDTSWPANVGNAEEWDQFSVNETKFGVKSTYVDGMYSTDLNESVIPEDYKKHADRLADEMERKARSRYMYRSDDSGNDNDDEEARFSAVAGTGRYAKRQVTKPRITKPQRPPRAEYLNRQSSSYASSVGTDQPPRTVSNHPAPTKKEPAAPESSEEASRNIKDNINALNLEPIRRKKILQLGGKAPGSSTTVSDLTEQRLLKKAEFEKALRDIELSLERRGWAGKATNGRPASEAAKRNVPLQLPSEAVSNDESQKQRLFQFNPNAITFTPKGNVSSKPTTEDPPPEEAPPPPPPPPPPAVVKPPPVSQEDSRPSPPSNFVKRNAFRPFDSAVAELRRRARRAQEEETTASDPESSVTGEGTHFYDVFLDSAREAIANQIPSQASPDWDCKLTTSYLDLLQPLPPAYVSASTQTFFIPPATSAPALNPAAPPFTSPPYLIRPVLAHGTPAPMDGAFQPIFLQPQQRWSPPGSQPPPDGGQWQVVSAPYQPEMFAYGLLACQRVPYMNR